MPSSLFADSSVQGDALDDQRALQIALDQLSLLGLDNDENPLYDNQEPRKKSVNMTECVPVPSSEHVAEIVGRQGVCFQHSFMCLSCYAAPSSSGMSTSRVIANTRSNTAYIIWTQSCFSAEGLKLLLSILSKYVGTTCEFGISIIHQAVISSIKLELLLLSRQLCHSVFLLYKCTVVGGMLAHEPIQEVDI